MATVQAWIETTRNHLMAGTQAERNSLGAAYTAGDGTLTFSAALGGIVPGVRLSIGTNTFYVRSVNNSGLSASVFAAQEGTTDQSAANGSLVWVAPRYTDAEILGALASEITDLSAPGQGLFQMRTIDLTYSSGRIGYDLAGVTDLLDVYEVRAQATGSLADWPRIPRHSWRLDRPADVAVFTSGLALNIWGTAYPGLKVRVAYRSGFTVPTSAGQDQSVTGLPLTAYDIPPMGAAIRLVAPREIKRNQAEAQVDTRRAAEVPPGAVAGSIRGLAALRAQRVQSEAQRLDAAFPAIRW